MTDVFVYGTLKQGFPNHYFLNGSRRLGTACTAGEWLLYGLSYPCMVSLDQLDLTSRKRLSAFAGHVYGEVYRVNAATLARLDGLEGTPDLYTRERFQVQFAPGKPAEVEGYRFARPGDLSTSALLVPNENNVLSWPAREALKRRAV